MRGAVRHAYDTTIRLATRLQLSKAQKQKLKRGRDQLQTMLERLGEVF